MKIPILLFLSLVMCIGSSVGQNPAAQPGEEFATIYIYRRDEGMIAANFFFWFKKTRPVYFRELTGDKAREKNRKIASLRNKQYFMMRLPAGKYLFDTRSSDHLELEVVSGGEYYLWVDQGNDCPDDDGYMIGPPTCQNTSASVVKVPGERWKRALTELKPIKSGDVKDRTVVIIPPGRSA